jgi:hypothetical protein
MSGARFGFEFAGRCDIHERNKEMTDSVLENDFLSHTRTDM